MNYPKERKRGLPCPHCGGDKLRREGRIYHHHRRTAARENVRAGIPAGVVMKISGHKTMSVFERYNITDNKDLRQAAEKRHLFIQIQRGDNRRDNGQDFGLVTPASKGDNRLKYFLNAPVAQVDRARDS